MKVAAALERLKETGGEKTAAMEVKGVALDQEVHVRVAQGRRIVQVNCGRSALHVVSCLVTIVRGLSRQTTWKWCGNYGGSLACDLQFQGWIVGMMLVAHNSTGGRRKVGRPVRQTSLRDRFQESYWERQFRNTQGDCLGSRLN